MVADFAREGEDFYDREKPSIGRLEDYVRKGAGFHEERHAVFTLEFWVSARSFADNREKLEGLLLRSGFYPLYKDKKNADAALLAKGMASAFGLRHKMHFLKEGKRLNGSRLKYQNRLN